MALIDKQLVRSIAANVVKYHTSKDRIEDNIMIQHTPGLSALLMKENGKPELVNLELNLLGEIYTIYPDGHLAKVDYDALDLDDEEGTFDAEVPIPESDLTTYQVVTTYLRWRLLVFEKAGK